MTPPVYSLPLKKGDVCPTHLAIGMFDGLHMGHTSVIKRAVADARKDGGVAGVFTFSEHPSAYFNPDAATPQLMPSENKQRILERLNIDTLIELPFNKEIASIDAENFAAWLKSALPKLKKLYIGSNFRFGKGRTGDTDLLAKTSDALGMSAIAMPRVEHNGEPVSSTRIRALLGNGRINEANECLGYHYFSIADTVSGKRIGSEIGFPTLNMNWEPELKPPYGVYAVSAHMGERIAGVANYGIRPTVESTDKPLLEVHLLEEADLEFSKPIRVDWLSFIRPEQKFDTVELLRTQIKQDCEAAKKIHAALE